MTDQPPLQENGHSNIGRWWFAGAMLVACLVAIGFAVHMAQLASIPKVEQVGGTVSLSDILVTLLTISGVTVPLIIGYMTLGKGGDCFCTVAEVIPFFLSERNYDVSTIKKTFLFWKDREDNKDGRVNSALLTLYEFTKMPNWPSGEHISHRARMHLLTGNHKARYHFYFESGEDRHGLIRYAGAIGLSGILCFVGICAIYARLAGEAFTFTANCVIIFNFLANLFAYIYLAMLIRFKAEIRAAALTQAKTFCEEIENDVRAASKESEQKGQRATQGLQDLIRTVTERLEKSQREKGGG